MSLKLFEVKKSKLRGMQVLHASAVLQATGKLRVHKTISTIKRVTGELIKIENSEKYFDLNGFEVPRLSGNHASFILLLTPTEARSIQLKWNKIKKAKQALLKFEAKA